MEDLMRQYDLSYEEIAYIGDDVNDLELLKRVGVAFSVSDAMEEVKLVADYVTKRRGGDGAVREISDLLLSCKA